MPHTITRRDEGKYCNRTKKFDRQNVFWNCLSTKKFFYFSEHINMKEKYMFCFQVTKFNKCCEMTKKYTWNVKKNTFLKHFYVLCVCAVVYWSSTVNKFTCEEFCYMRSKFYFSHTTQDNGEWSLLQFQLLYVVVFLQWAAFGFSSSFHWTNFIIDWL